MKNKDNKRVLVTRENIIDAIDGKISFGELKTPPLKDITNYRPCNQAEKIAKICTHRTKEVLPMLKKVTFIGENGFTTPDEIEKAVANTFLTQHFGGLPNTTCEEYEKYINSSVGDIVIDGETFSASHILKSASKNYKKHVVDYTLKFVREAMESEESLAALLDKRGIAYDSFEYSAPDGYWVDPRDAGFFKCRYYSPAEAYNSLMKNIVGRFSIFDLFTGQFEEEYNKLHPSITVGGHDISTSAALKLFNRAAYDLELKKFTRRRFFELMCAAKDGEIVGFTFSFNRFIEYSCNFQFIANTPTETKE